MRGQGLAAVTQRRYGGAMNSTVTTTPTRPPARPLALPNILTYGRIAAVPVVVGCMFWQNILHGGLWLRWVALAIFIAAGVSRFPRWLPCADVGPAILARPHARSDRR